jgi:hypothetical protein
MAEGEASSDPKDAAAKAVAKDEIKEALQAGAVSESAGLPEHLRHLSQRSQWQELELKRISAEQEHDLKGKYARGLLFLLGGQLLAANAVFVLYAAIGKHWKLDPVVINIWLGATVVEVVGVVSVVTHHLFPRRDSKA